MSAHNIAPLRNSSSIYFGKIPSRGDFVKSTSGAKVIALIDNWIAQGMEMLSNDPGWKSRYDSAGAIDFLFITTHKEQALCGSLIPSSDASSRRFPFIAATLFETTDHPLAFLPLSPLMLERHISHQRALMHHAANIDDAGEALAMLNDIPLDAGFDLNEFANGYSSFLIRTTLTGITDAMALGHEHATVRQMVLAIGYLLQPILKNRTTPPQKGLAIPLPCEPAKASFAKAFWLDLICTFLPRKQFELSIFSCARNGKPKFVVTFNGVTPAMFQALFDEHAAREHLIDLSQSSWVEELAMKDTAALKLSSYLEHDTLSLRQIVETFRQLFSE